MLYDTDEKRIRRYSTQNDIMKNEYVNAIVKKKIHLFCIEEIKLTKLHFVFFVVLRYCFKVNSCVMYIGNLPFLYVPNLIRKSLINHVLPNTTSS